MMMSSLYAVHSMNFQKDYTTFLCPKSYMDEANEIRLVYPYWKSLERNGTFWELTIASEDCERFDQDNRLIEFNMWERKPKKSAKLLYDLSNHVNQQEKDLLIRSLKHFGVLRIDERLTKHKILRADAAFLHYQESVELINQDDVILDVSLFQCFKCGSYKHRQENCFSGIICRLCSDLCQKNHYGYCRACDEFHKIHKPKCEMLDVAIPVIKGSYILPFKAKMVVWDPEAKGKKKNNVLKEIICDLDCDQILRK